MWTSGTSRCRSNPCMVGIAPATLGGHIGGDTTEPAELLSETGVGFKEQDHSIIRQNWRGQPLLTHDRTQRDNEDGIGIVTDSIFS
jgi:hypothetical protein